MKNLAITFLLLAAIAFPAKAQTFTYDFTTGYEGWSGDFADYPITDSVFYELEFTRTTLPAPLNTSKYALKITGNNHSDDLFMFIKRKITGLLPNTTYTVLIDVEFASSAPTNAFGVGGSPGEGVWVKAGASLVEPQKVNMSGFYEMNINKGYQAAPGPDMDTIGHVGVSDTTTQFTLIQRSNAGHLFTITTNASGEVWVCIGTDSGYEATTTLYYNELSFTFTAVLGIDDPISFPGIVVYPNPSTGQITIDQLSPGSQIEVYNQFGQLVLDKISSFASKADLDLSAQVAGVYWVKVSNGRQVCTEKIMLH